MRVLLTAIAVATWFGILGAAFADPPSKGAPMRSKSAPKAADTKGKATPPLPWKALLGKEITLVGRGENAKVGAILLGDEMSIWVDLPGQSWPGEVSHRTAANPDALRRKVKVTGTLEQWSDLPVFTPSQSRGQAGILVPEGTNLEEARKRNILVDVKWELVPEETALSTREDVIAMAKGGAAAPKAKSD